MVHAHHPSAAVLLLLLMHTLKCKADIIPDTMLMLALTAAGVAGAYSGCIQDHAKGLQQRYHFRCHQAEPDAAHGHTHASKGCIHPAQKQHAVSGFCVRLTGMQCTHVAFKQTTR